MSFRQLTRRRFATSVLSLAASSAVAQSSTFTNPIVGNGADPWVVLYNGNYYLTDTNGGNVSIEEASTLAGLNTVGSDVVYSNSNTGNVWAPELHYNANGHWYIYYSATVGDQNNSNHKMYVLQSASSNPLSAYTLMGQITDPTNGWAIDGTTLQTSTGSMYFIWSGWANAPVDGTTQNQNLYIAPMSNPYTVSGSRTLISSPTNAWEQVGSPWVNEGPEVLTGTGGTQSVIYSASGSWTTSYALGQLVLTTVDNPLLASSWTKDNAGPVFQSGNNVWAPGHASYTTSDNGTRNWIVYHAEQTYNSGWTRNVRTQPYSFNPDGTPSFGQPVAVTVPIQWGPTSWVGAINESNNDTVHDYLNTANWVNGVVTDSFANVTLTDNTTLYLSADHATTGDIIYTYGSGQEFLSFQSNSATTRTWTMNGNMDVAILGGNNSIFISTPARPVTLAMGASQRTFNISSTGTVWIQGGLTGSGGLSLIGGGELVLQGAKTYTGPTLITQGILSAGDGTTASSTANLPSTTAVMIQTSGELLLPGLAVGGANETIAGLTGNGLVSGPTNPVTLTIAPATAGTFSGQLTGGQLSLTESGPATETLSGTSTYTGLTMVIGGSLHVTGAVTATSGLRLTGGSAVIDTGGSVVTTGFSSVGLNTGNTGAFTVGGGSATNTGALTVNGDFNVGDNGTGSLSLLPGGSLTVETLYVGKFGSASGVVNQTGGTVTSILGTGGDWQIGGTNTAAASAVGVYNLSGGSLSTLNNLQIGAYGTGTVNQTGGTAAASGFISIGRFPGATGFYNLSGGSLTGTVEPLLIVGEQGAGTLNVSGTGVVTGNTLAVGLNGGVGKVDQTGGTVDATIGVTLGQAPGGLGSYILSGGTLITPSITVGSGIGTFSFDGGTLQPTTSANPLSTFSTLAIRGGMVINTNGFNIAFNTPLTHDSTAAGPDGGVTKVGAGTLTLGASDSYTGNTNVSAGTLVFAVNTATTPMIRKVGVLSVGAGATFVASAPAGMSVQSAGGSIGRTLIVATGLNDAGTLNLSNSDLDVKGGDIGTISGLIADGYNLPAGGNWSGPGITSSAAAADTSHLTAVGAILAGIPGGSLVDMTLDGQSLSATDVIARYTYNGDANLDGKVDGSDYSLIDAGFAADKAGPGSATGWYNGDFNYDGTVDGSDYALIDNAFNNQGGQFAAGSTSALVAESSAQVAALPTAVPEPIGLALASLAVSLIGRRCRPSCAY